MLPVQAPNNRHQRESTYFITFLKSYSLISFLSNVILLCNESSHTCAHKANQTVFDWSTDSSQGIMGLPFCVGFIIM